MLYLLQGCDSSGKLDSRKSCKSAFFVCLFFFVFVFVFLFFCFFGLCFMSSCHLASSPFICHDGISFKAKLHQRGCNRFGRLSDVSDIYAFFCWIFSAATVKKGMVFVGLIALVNGEFKLHTVKALHHYTINLFKGCNR